MPNRANSAKVAHDGRMRGLLDAVGDWAVGPGPLFRQLARAIAGSIERGELARGTRLPAERVLASALVVSRGTAVAAYDLLVSEGLIERVRGSGTYVLGAGVLGLPPGREGSALVHRLVDRSAGPADVVDLSISVLRDADGLPRRSVSTTSLGHVVPDTGYSPWGLGGLREAVADHVREWGLPTKPSEIVITTGAQQALSAAAACWLRPGDTVVVEDPTYPGAVAAFTQAGATLVGVPVDRYGVSADALIKAVAKHRPALVYLQPTLHSPTGAVLSPGRRRRIAELIASSRVPLVEDMALADLAWATDGVAPPPIASLCPGASVAVIGSLSKLFWGGLRIGFVRAPETVAVRFARVKATQDLGSSAVSQLLAEALLRALAGGDDFVAVRHNQLRQRYAVLARALRAQLPSWSWPDPGGGMSLWVHVPVDDAEAFAQSALRHGVAVATAAALSPSDRHHDRIRLSFSGPPDELEEGVRRLAAAWQARAG